MKRHMICRGECGLDCGAHVAHSHEGLPLQRGETKDVEECSCDASCPSGDNVSCVPATDVEVAAARLLGVKL